MTRDEVLARMSYCPETGLFTAKVSAGRRRAGDVLGYVRTDGYRMIAINGKWHYAHRLAWLYMTGRHPVDEIDHINGQRDDNRFENLRECTRSQNMMNVPKRGVCFHKGRRKWQASIRLHGKRTYLGTFTTEAEALEAYRVAAQRLHGEFANVAAPSQADMLIEAERPKAQKDDMFKGYETFDSAEDDAHDMGGMK